MSLQVDALVFFLVTIIAIYLRDRWVGLSKTVDAGGWRQMTLKEYLNSDHHWNSYGHLWGQFFFTAILFFSFLGKSWWLFLIPTFVLALMIEAVQGFKWKTFDFWFDLFTHNAGAWCFMLLVI